MQCWLLFRFLLKYHLVFVVLDVQVAQQKSPARPGWDPTLDSCAPMEPAQCIVSFRWVWPGAVRWWCKGPRFHCQSFCTWCSCFQISKKEWSKKRSALFRGSPGSIWLLSVKTGPLSCSSSRPKHHSCDHMGMQVARTKVNPRKAMQCFGDESFLGFWKRIGVKCHSTSILRRIYQRYLLFISLRWRDTKAGSWLGIWGKCHVACSHSQFLCLATRS